MPKFNIVQDEHYDYTPEDSEAGEFEVDSETRARWANTVRAYHAMQDELCTLVEIQEAKAAEVARLELAAKQAAYDAKTESLVNHLT